MSGTPANTRLIDRYLDRLLVELRGPAHDVRRILAEAEEHLRDATAEGIEAGLPEEEAQREAIRRFGPPREIARRFGRIAPPPRAVLRALTVAAVPFGALGMVAIGVSGLIAEILGRVISPAFVAGDLPWVRYTPDRCAEFQAMEPGKSCEAAATLDHWAEVTVPRIAVGVLGLLVLGAFALYRRRASTDLGELLLPPGMVQAIGVTLYGVVTLVLLGQAADAAVLGGMHGGTGQWLSAGAVSLVMAAAYGTGLLRTLAGRTAVPDPAEDRPVPS